DACPDEFLDRQREPIPAEEFIKILTTAHKWAVDEDKQFPHLSSPSLGGELDKKEFPNKRICFSYRRSKEDGEPQGHAHHELHKGDAREDPHQEPAHEEDAKDEDAEQAALELRLCSL
ncbi:unnamed protein product, partial [Amoebophrya sp. A25]